MERSTTDYQLGIEIKRLRIITNAYEVFCIDGEVLTGPIYRTLETA